MPGRPCRLLFGRRPLDVIAAVALLGQVVIAAGLPVPAPHTRRAGIPFPCQHRACGCVTADRCWAGDCCCFTLAEKLAWAEARGLDAPAHARAAVAARRAKPPAPCKKACCDEQPAPDLRDGVSVVWVAGASAQKCRGDGADGLLRLDPAVVPDPTALAGRAGDACHPAPASDRIPSVTRRPPCRPPRLR